MTSDRQLSRRTLLGAGGVGLSTAALAACGSGSKEKDSASQPAGNTPASQSQTKSSTSAARSTSATATSESSSSAAGGANIAKLSAIPVGGSLEVKANGKPVVLSQKTAGMVTAFSAICTHMGCTVGAGGAVLHCPCHGSSYNAFTGAVLGGPAPRPLPKIEVEVKNGEVVVK